MKYAHDSVRLKTCEIFNLLLEDVNASYRAAAAGAAGGVGGGSGGKMGNDETKIEDDCNEDDDTMAVDGGKVKDLLASRKRKRCDDEEGDVGDGALFGFQVKLKYFKAAFVKKVASSFTKYFFSLELKKQHL